MFDKTLEEHYLKQGAPDKPTYYIIRRISEFTGLLARYRMVMGHVRYALSKGWLPVVDMQNYPNAYLAPDKLGKENSWEYYFEQPLRIGIEEAYNGENIVLSHGEFVEPYPGHSMNFLEDRDLSLTEWRTLIELGLIKIKSDLWQEFSAERAKLFAPEERVLGVLLRGTDYVKLKLKNHPIQPPVEFAMSTVAEKLKEWKCDKIFLATEDKSIVEKFKEAFGKQCVILDREYVDYDPKKDKTLAKTRIERENDNYLQGKEYLTQIAILSMCNCFVGARCSGTSVVMMWQENFENTYFFNLGKYGVFK